MNNKHSNPSKAVAPPISAVDDFKVIAGIGPGIERRFHNAGIQTFAQLAALSLADIAALVTDLAGMSTERIAQQDWIGQARELVPEPVEAAPPVEETFAREHQHYATFTVELLLDEENNVRRTRVVHLQDKNEETWAGWEETRMVSFISRHADLRLPEVEPAPVSVVTTEPATAGETTAVETPVAVRGSNLRLQALETVPAGATEPHHILHRDQSFSVQLTLDLAEVTMPGDESLTYSATIYAKSFRGGLSQVVSEVSDTIRPQAELTITMPGRPLSTGTYRLEATVTLVFSAAKADILAHLEGGLLMVY